MVCLKGSLNVILEDTQIYKTEAISQRQAEQKYSLCQKEPLRAHLD